MGIKKEMAGKRFGRLVVISEAGVDKYRNITWLCKCDCGNTKVIVGTSLRIGLTVSCGCYQSEISSKCKMGEKNPMWKGNKVSLVALHVWIKSRKPKSSKCVRCKKKKPQDLANISQEYKRDPDDYEWLCRKCHMDGDGRNKRRNERGQYARR